MNIGRVGQIPKTIIRTKDPNNHSDRTYLPLLLRANYLGNLKTKQKQCSIEYYFQEKFFLLLSMTISKEYTFFQFKLIFLTSDINVLPEIKQENLLMSSLRRNCGDL